MIRNWHCARDNDDHTIDDTQSFLNGHSLYISMSIIASIGRRLLKLGRLLPPTPNLGTFDHYAI